jgi:hypothetical protein
MSCRVVHVFCSASACEARRLASCQKLQVRPAFLLSIAGRSDVTSGGSLAYRAPSTATRRTDAAARGGGRNFLATPYNPGMYRWTAVESQRRRKSYVTKTHSLVPPSPSMGRSKNRGDTYVTPLSVYTRNLDYEFLIPLKYLVTKRCRPGMIPNLVLESHRATCAKRHYRLY